MFCVSVLCIVFPFCVFLFGSLMESASPVRRLSHLFRDASPSVLSLQSPSGPLATIRSLQSPLGPLANILFWALGHLFWALGRWSGRRSHQCWCFTALSYAWHVYWYDLCCFWTFAVFQNFFAHDIVLTQCLFRSPFILIRPQLGVEVIASL